MGYGRAPYNTTCSIKYGPLSVFGTPGTVWRSGVPCRLITADRIVQYGQASLVPTAYLTMDSFASFPLQYTVSAGGLRTLHIKAGYEFAIASIGPSYTHYSVYLDNVTPYRGTPYVRVWLHPLPYPPP